MGSRETIKERLAKEGFPIINECSDLPNKITSKHDHPGDILLIVTSGLIEITIDKKTSVLKPGDEIFLPARVLHSAKAGPEGCSYIDGERPAVRE